LCKRRDGPARFGDVFAMRLGFLGGAVDSAALSPTETMKWDAEAALSEISPVVWFCSATAPLTVSNTGRIARSLARCDARHRLNPRRPFAAPRSFGDFFGGVLGLHRQRLDLGGDDGKAAPGVSGPRRFDGGVERQQRGLPRDLGDQVDDVADRGEDSRKRSTLALASRAASLARSASLLAPRTCSPMPCAEWVNLSAPAKRSSR